MNGHYAHSRKGYVCLVPDFENDYSDDRFVHPVIFNLHLRHRYIHNL